MNRTRVVAAALAAAVLLTVGPPAFAGIAVVDGRVNAGFDLYQLDFVLTPSATSDDPPRGLGFDPDFEPTGFFEDFEVVGVPLGAFDFGQGPEDVGLASAIVRRLQDGVSIGLEPTFVSVELVALSLRTVSPIDIGDGVFEDLYVSLDPSAPSIGSYEFRFFGQTGETLIGDMSATFNVNYQLRVGSPEGTLFDSGSVALQSSFGLVPFSHFPEGLSPFNAPDKLVSGVNFLLGEGQDADFFQLGAPLVLQNVTDGESDFRFTELAWEHANSNDPGDSPGNPILPDEIVGATFVFNDAPQQGWFDPPLATGYVYETDGLSNFVSVFLPTFGLVPDADGQFVISSVLGDVTVFAGQFFTFDTPVDRFVIQGIDPAVDGGDPLAFPAFLVFDSFSNSFTQTPIPEPAAASLALLGSAAAFGRRG